MQPGGRSAPLARATRTFPSATIEVAPSNTIERPRPGTPTDQGLVERNRACPPNGTTDPRPGPAAPTVTTAISPAAAARSVYSPNRPMCIEWRTATAAIPPRRARARAQSRAKAVEKCPNPRLASTTAATSVSRTSVGRAAGRRAPRSASPTYCGTRITPWESWPERLARIRCAATTPAISSSAPMALKTASTYVCSGAGGQICAEPAIPGCAPLYARVFTPAGPDRVSFLNGFRDGQDLRRDTRRGWPGVARDPALCRDRAVSARPLDGGRLARERPSGRPSPHRGGQGLARGPAALCPRGRLRGGPSALRP